MPTQRPVPSSDAVSRFMSRLRRRDTGPEIALRQSLHRRGVRYRLHRPDLPGRPDLAVVRIRLAVFVDGCFWQGCPEHGVAPKSNAEFWRTKIESNRVRDRRNDARLQEMGWTPMHVWEHQDPDEVAEHVRRLYCVREAEDLRASGAPR
jgi:DNA mismatch endonuclease, patch repair protein